MQKLNINNEQEQRNQEKSLERLWREAYGSEAGRRKIDFSTDMDEEEEEEDWYE